MSSKSLLQIPLELREQIIEEIIIDFQIDLSEKGMSPRDRFHMFEHCPRKVERTMCHIDEHKADYWLNTHGLLLANRQLREETLSCFRRLNVDLESHVNAMWIQPKPIPGIRAYGKQTGERLLLVWNWVPAMVPNDPVDLTIKLSYDAPTSSIGEWKSLYLFILRFLRHGAIGRCERVGGEPAQPTQCHEQMKKEGNRCTIKTLYINCTTRETPIRPNSRNFARGINHFFKVLFHRDPKYCVTRRKLSPDDAHVCPDGSDLAFRAIGRIVILADSKPVDEWDVAECMKYMAYVARTRGVERSAIVPGSKQEMDFEDWYMQVCESRNRQGLDAPDSGPGEWGVKEAKKFGKRHGMRNMNYYLPSRSRFAPH